ncbi:unnamed protein product [Phytophthora fragariaefolia]|uniref:Unnamed protein product n=1 Tax=Phytophthora fragariaefolia TaxID=1490495 RepID=A0A9W6Y309_9STRA|nr:unnamed protein product [Phytophthora fragariaefolia]
MASLLKDGSCAEHNARIVLQTFCERAYTAKQESLKHTINVEAADPPRQLKRAIEHLTKLADSDRAIDQTRKRGQKTTAFEGIIASFIGFQEGRTGIHAYSQNPTNKVWHTRDYKFIDTVSASGTRHTIQPEQISEATTNTEREKAPLTPERVKTMGEFFLPDEAVAEINGRENPTKMMSERISARQVGMALATAGEVVREPSNMVEARRSKQWSFWCKAILKEMAALEANNTGPLVELPSGQTTFDNSPISSEAGHRSTANF